MTKNYYGQEIERKFKKDASVFKDWKADTAKSLEKCAEIDSTFMNLGKLIKEETELYKVYKVIKNNIAWLHKCHLDIVI